jgi:hypothetical protein
MLIRIRSTVPGGATRLFADMHDYMQTPEFAVNVQNVMVLAAHERCALMCAEAVPWRCHRSLIADALSCAACAWKTSSVPKDGNCI